MRTSGDGDDGAGLRRRGGQHARDGAGGGRTCVVAEKNCACPPLLPRSLLPLSLEGKRMGAKKPQKRTTRKEKWRQLSATRDRPSEEKDGWICARIPSLALCPTSSVVPPSFAQSRLDRSPRCRLPAIETRKQAPLPLRSTKSTRVSLKQLLVCPLRRGVAS